MGDGSENFIPRGIRNNNPGNIKKNNIEWEGLVPEDEQTDQTFFISSLVPNMALEHYLKFYLLTEATD
jgi:hypothetical protein